MTHEMAMLVAASDQTETWIKDWFTHASAHNLVRLHAMIRKAADVAQARGKPGSISEALIALAAAKFHELLIDRCQEEP